MTLQIEVMINDPKGGRRPMQAEIVRLNQKTLVVKLVNEGNIVKRLKRRDLR